MDYVGLWLRAVLKHWKRELLGGVLIGLLALISDLSGRTLPPHIYEGCAALLVFYAMFLAWRDQYTETQVLNGQIADAKGRQNEGPFAILRFDNGDGAVSLLVTNKGSLATFSASFFIDGDVKGNLKRDLCGRWSHTDSTETAIARGQTRRLILANVMFQEIFQQWQILASSQSGNIYIPASQSGSARTVPIIRPADIVINGEIVAQPDLINGIQPFKVVLHAFEAEYVASR
jgi:hypothetical protein